jgi:hypothetical protein
VRYSFNTATQKQNMNTKKTARVMTKEQERENPPPDGHLRLYHGGSVPAGGSPFFEVPGGKRFDGFFAHVSRNSSWDSHGTNGNYFSDISEEKLLSNYALNYEIPYKTLLSVFEFVTGFKEGGEMFDAAWTAVIEDKHYEVQDEVVFSDPNLDDDGLIAQKYRGQIAKRLGYQAVEMQDEHGTSWLMTPGVKLTCVS